VRVSILVSSRRSPKAGRFGEAPKSFTYNNASQLTNAGYVYDGLGRNTSIPAADSPNSVGVISLSYRVNDQVASITQNGVTTAYSFDGLGRRVSETTGSSVVTKHYTGTSDNPAWSSNNAGVTDIYTSSLGTGLNGTVTLDNGVKTLSLDVNDLRGNTVTRINVDSATTDSWVSFDEYGNREGSSTGKLVTYDAYGQYERATTSQGLILMGARLYNPVTNQFTSPDPITGGNETTYTYPNDPINKNDFTGLAAWVVGGVSFLLALALTTAICGATLGAGCIVTGLILAGIAGAATSGAEADEMGLKGRKRDEYVLTGAAIGAASRGLGVGVAKKFGDPVRRILKSKALAKPTSMFMRSSLGRGLKIGPRQVKGAREALAEKGLTWLGTRLSERILDAMTGRG